MREFLAKIVAIKIRGIMGNYVTFDKNLIDLECMYHLYRFVLSVLAFIRTHMCSGATPRIGRRSSEILARAESPRYIYFRR